MVATSILRRLASRGSLASRGLLVIAGLLAGSTPSALAAEDLGAGAAKASPPNVLVILVDDLGYTDLGCYGSSFYDTPNVDRLAATGMRFTDGYAACPVCSPTRSSMLTGKYPSRTGVTDFIGARGPDKWKRNTRLLPAEYRREMALDEVTLAEALSAEGYATFFAGKWHLGSEGFWPEDQGFDVNRGGIERGGPYGGKKYFSPYGNLRLDDGPDGEHLPDRLARETVKFFEAHPDQPVFAYLSFYSVHTPLMARDDLRRKYEARRESIADEESAEDSRWGKERARKVRRVQDHAVYAGMVEAMDQAVGTVLDALESLGVADNTLVVFTSDNGGLSTSEGHPTSNLPLRAGKGWMYEGGIREPWIVRWPGVTKSGSVTQAMVTSPDLYPTVLEALGLETRPEQHVDGESFVPALRGQEYSRGPMFWHYPHYGNQGGAPSGAIRDGSWKLIEWFEDDRVELFDLATDIGEARDLSGDRPETVSAMRKALRRFQTDTGAKIPIVNSAFTPKGG